MKKHLIAFCLGLVIISFSSCHDLGLVGKGCGPATDKKPDFKSSKVNTTRPVCEDYVLYDKTKIRSTDSNGLHKK